MRFEPKSQQAATSSSNNCGYPAAAAAAVKTSKHAPAAKSADKPADAKQTEDKH
jgi:hypothetical protein